MTDDEVISFEGRRSARWVPSRQHVRVAWWYARHHPWRTALNLFQDNLRAFATAHGKPERYHETITVAFMALVADHRKRDGARELT
jgi:hypothetical protein